MGVQNSTQDDPFACFEQALELYYRQEYQAAAQVFSTLEAAVAPEEPLAERIRVYRRICARRIQAEEAANREPKTPEEWYDQGVYWMNCGDHQRAMESLLQTLEKAPSLAPSVYYALAAVHAQRGEWEPALKYLRQAIGMAPEHRIMASNDPDFDSLREIAEFTALLKSET